MEPDVGSDVELVRAAQSGEAAALGTLLARHRAGMRAVALGVLGVEPRPFDLREELPKITVPALVVVGAHDFICGPRWAGMLTAGIPHARTLTLADSGHFGHLEQPEEFDSAVVDLVTKAAAR